MSNQDYTYDIFISYNHRKLVEKWVKEIFLELLTTSLDNLLPGDVTIFIDDRLDNGSHWPSELIAAHKKSKILVAIFSAKYFASRWCVAELQSMQQRAKNYELPEKRLIYPIILWDTIGEDLPPYLAGMHFNRDLSKYNHIEIGYKQTQDYEELKKIVFHHIAPDVKKMIVTAPPWSPDFPVEMPDPVIKPNTPMPQVL